MNSNGQNVLITSAGRRVSLVRLFQSALTKFENNGRVLIADNRPTYSAAAQVSDLAISLPKVTEPKYISALLEACQENSVSLVIPTIDTELIPLAVVRTHWMQEYGINIVISDEILVRQCRNKRETADVFSNIGIRPLTEIGFSSTIYPRMVKPVSGSRSVDLHVVRAVGEMKDEYADMNIFIHQELVNVHEYREFTVDAFFGLRGELLCLVPRERIEVRDGEVSKGRTYKGQLLEMLRPKIGLLRGAVGCLTIQVFARITENHEIEDLIGIEINPRFGGGYPLTEAAGATYTDWLVQEHFNQTTRDYFDSWTDNLLMLRYDSEVFLNA